MLLCDYWYNFETFEINIGWNFEHDICLADILSQNISHYQNFYDNHWFKTLLLLIIIELKVSNVETCLTIQ